MMPSRMPDPCPSQQLSWLSSCLWIIVQKSPWQAPLTPPTPQGLASTTQPHSWLVGCSSSFSELQTRGPLACLPAPLDSVCHPRELSASLKLPFFLAPYLSQGDQHPSRCLNPEAEETLLSSRDPPIWFLLLPLSSASCPSRPSSPSCCCLSLGPHCLPALSFLQLPSTGLCHPAASLPVATVAGLRVSPPLPGNSPASSTPCSKPSGT